MTSWATPSGGTTRRRRAGRSYARGRPSAVCSASSERSGRRPSEGHRGGRPTRWYARSTASSSAGPTTSVWARPGKPTGRSMSTHRAGYAGGYAASTRCATQGRVASRSSTCTTRWDSSRSPQCLPTLRERWPETLSESRMRTRMSGSMSGDWRRRQGASIATPPDERGGNS